ncbi:hypothetical protein B0T21DRAFT_348562 [Apiosordaria backusii]|uniref:Uncharacterized protein n=1 Tax=Apiosordaria backusii TaxID=314023 RepID=A0AA40EG93_9PEZI|nr:hypothetical protein B0T21DRAFT_348562 [Apiosordaria backusii]
MNANYPQYIPPEERRRGGCRMLCCLFTAGFIAISLAWVGFFGITGQLGTHYRGYGYGYAVDGAGQSDPSTLIPTPEPVHQVNLQSDLTKRDHAGGGAALGGDPRYPPRVPNPQSGRLEEYYDDKSGKRVSLTRKPKKNKIVILPIPWGPHVYPIPWRPLSKKKSHSKGGALPIINLPMAFVKPSSPVSTFPSGTASSAPTLDEATTNTRWQKNRWTGRGRSKVQWEARGRQRALWRKALDRWAQEEEQLELGRLEHDNNYDDWFTQGDDVWNQYKQWFYAQAEEDNFLLKGEFMFALLERYRLWTPRSRTPEECYPIMETKYTAWDMSKEFPCIVAIARLQQLDALHGVENVDHDSQPDLASTKPLFVPRASPVPKADGGEHAHVGLAVAASDLPGDDFPPFTHIMNTPYFPIATRTRLPQALPSTLRTAIAARSTASLKPELLIPLVPPIYEDDDENITYCEFRINKNGNIEVRCPGLFSTDGKKFDRPDSKQKTSVPSVTYKEDPVTASMVHRSTSRHSIANDNLPSPTPAPTKTSTTREPPFYSLGHGPGILIPSEVTFPSSSASIARHGAAPSRVWLPTGPGPMVQPAPTRSIAPYQGPAGATTHEPLEIHITLPPRSPASIAPFSSSSASRSSPSPSPEISSPSPTTEQEGEKQIIVINGPDYTHSMTIPFPTECVGSCSLSTREKEEQGVRGDG